MVKFRAQKGFLRGNIDYREDDITLTCSQGVKKELHTIHVQNPDREGAGTRHFSHCQQLIQNPYRLPETADHQHC